MPRSIQRMLFSVGALAALAYTGAVGFLAFRETSLVFVSAGESRSTRIVPADSSTIPWDTLRVTAADSVTVFLLESRLSDAGDSGAVWAIYLHGNAGLVGSRGNVSRYELLREAGFNVLAVEYRGYGASRSAGVPSEAGVHEDARAAWDHLTRSRGVDPRRIVVYGWSLGSGPATRLAADRRPAALVTEGGFTSLPDIGAAMYPWVPVRLIMRNRFDNLSLARTLEMPWVIFHGRADVEVPFPHGESLAAAAPNDRFVALEADHNDGVIGDRHTALEVLRDLRRRVVVRETPPT